MKSLIFAQTLFIGLLFGAKPAAHANGYNPADGLSPAASLTCRIYPTGQEKNQYTLTMLRPETQAAEVRVLAKDGSLVDRSTVKAEATFCRLNLSDLNPGQYTIQVRSGSQVREEKVTVE